MRRFLSLVVAGLVLSGLGAAPALAQGDDDGPVLEEPSGGGAPKPEKGYQKTVDTAIDDIQEFWGDEFPKIYDAEYDPVPEENIIAATPGTDIPCNGEIVGSYEDVQGNAFYNADCNLVAYDDEELFPQFYNDYGEFSVAFVLAHEWGHAAQARAGTIENEDVYVELQADCFAGAWTKRVQDGDSPLELHGGELDGALGALLQVADVVGDLSGGHGSAFDRVSAFQNGLDAGAEGCVGYFDPATQPQVLEIPFSGPDEAANGGNVDADVVIPLTVDLLNDFYTQTTPDVYEPIAVDAIASYDSGGKKSHLPKCGGDRLKRKDITNRIFYCQTDGYIGFDEPYIQSVYDNIGDFGVALLFSNVYATYVQSLQDFPGVDDNETNAVLGADCYSGAFANAVNAERLQSDKLDGVLQPIRLSAGDLDETIQAFIDYNAARGVGSDVDFSFIRVATFRDGFVNGFESCAQWADPDVIDQLDS